MTVTPLESDTRTDAQTDPAAPITVPSHLASSEAKLVYLYLTVRGTVTVDELGMSLCLPKLSLFSILQSLDEADLVVRDGDAVSVA